MRVFSDPPFVRRRVPLLSGLLVRLLCPLTLHQMAEINLILQDFLNIPRCPERIAVFFIPREADMTSDFEIASPYLPRAPVLGILQKAATGVAVAALRYRCLSGWRISKGSPSSLWEIVRAYHYPPRCHRARCAEPGLRLNASRSDSLYRITS